MFKSSGPELPLFKKATAAETGTNLPTQKGYQAWLTQTSFFHSSSP